MKKLMIAAAIVCAAVVSQAAAYNWTTANVKAYGSTTDLANGSAHIILYVAGTSTIYAEDDAPMVNGVIGKLVGGNVPAGTQVDAQYVLKDAAGNTFTSALLTKKNATDPANAPIAFGSRGSWTAAPEPTSGLLLLLGVGALALRRRRA